MRNRIALQGSCGNSAMMCFMRRSSASGSPSVLFTNTAICARLRCTFPSASVVVTDCTFIPALSFASKSTCCSTVRLIQKFWSAAYDRPTKMGKRAKVMSASIMETRFGVHIVYTTNTQMYASMAKNAVMRNTLRLEMRRTSPLGTLIMQTEEIASRLNAADPTMVAAPSSPGFCFSGGPRFFTVSKTARRISGALEPKARSVRLATVGFQYLTLIAEISPVFGSVIFIVVCLAVITSMADMNLSEMMAMPRNRKHKNNPYVAIRNQLGSRLNPGSSSHESVHDS
mmetsp:Transcript_29767/g.74455  ORF Transcript_29767/g.74455 Transcript_29767/m.74455 type:complete len:285 (-) Transcript_29767:493-1347(-)